MAQEAAPELNIPIPPQQGSMRALRASVASHRGREGLHDLRNVLLRQLGDEEAVAVDVVDARDGGPELGLAHPGGGEGCLLAVVGAVPLVRHHLLGRVRRMLQRVAQPAASEQGHS